MFAAGFSDGADLMLVDKEIRLALARETQHGVVKVLNPTTHRLSIAQLDLDDYLAVAEGAQVERFLSGFTRRRRLGTVALESGEVILQL